MNFTTHADLAKHITNVRYAEPGKIAFDFQGKTYKMKEPMDVMLVGFPGADKWIAIHFDFVLGILLK